jgi:hypothetical protein
MASRASAACRSRSAAPAFGTRYRERNPDTGELDGGVLPIDLAANAASLGATVWRANTIAEFRDAVAAAAGHDGVGVIVVPVDRESRVAGYGRGGMCRSPRSRRLPEVQGARAAYEVASAKSATFCDQARTQEKTAEIAENAKIRFGSVLCQMPLKSRSCLHARRGSSLAVGRILRRARAAARADPRGEALSPSKASCSRARARRRCATSARC